MYSTHNQGKSVVVERFIGTWKNKIYKLMIAVSKNVYINKYNNTYHRTIKMKPIDVQVDTYVGFEVQLGTYNDFSVQHNDTDPKFKVGDHVIISKYKNIFAKYYT